MLIRVYYLFIPKKELLELTRNFSPEIKELFLDSFMWSKYEGGITSWEAKENELELKCLFLAKFWSDYGSSNSEELTDLMYKLIGEPPFEVSLVDKWWEIKKFEEDETFEEVQSSLTFEGLNILKKTGNNLVDDSIHILKKNKKNTN